MILNGYDAQGRRVSETRIDGVPVAEWERRQEPGLFQRQASALLAAAAVVIGLVMA